MTNLDDLEQLALAATPGPWLAGSDYVTADLSFESTLLQLNSTNSAADGFDLSFIAAANPSAIIDLIARCRKAEDEAGNLKSAVSHESDVAESYKAEADELRQQLAAAQARERQYREAANRIEALEAENASLRDDAERLGCIGRMLFTRHWNGVVGSGSKTTWRLVGDYRNTIAKMEGTSFRDAIDAARGKS